MQGYNELRSGAAWLDVSGRGEVRVGGEDRARFLHAMTTNHIQQLKPGTGCYAFFLTAQGRILADVNVLCRQDSFLLDTEPETKQKLLEHLEKFIIGDDATVEDFTPALATIAIEGPKSPDVITEAGFPVPGIYYGDNLDSEAGLVARLSVTGSTGFFVIVPTAEKDAALSKIQAAGAAAADKEAFNIVRLEHGKPRYGEDISDRYLAQEADQEQALNFHKGCYLGQEIVERLRSRGLISRVLTALEIEGQTPPEPRTKLRVGDAPAAEITSAAYSPALGRVVALGYVRVEYAKPGTEFTTEDLRARVRMPHAS